MQDTVSKIKLLMNKWPNVLEKKLPGLKHVMDSHASELEWITLNPLILSSISTLSKVGVDLELRPLKWL